MYRVKTNKLRKRFRSGDLMAERYKLKITVLKRTDTKQIFGDNPPHGQVIEACSVFKEGQEFIVEDDGKMPEGFCHWAWDDLYKAVVTLRFGGNFPWSTEHGTGIFCCTDGYRPVIFEIKRIQ